MKKLNILFLVLFFLIPSLLFSAEARYFAEIKDGVVQRVVVVNSQEWCEKALGGTWVETFMDSADKNYAGKGYTYQADKSNFASPKPYASWTLDAKCQWQPPMARPKEPAVWDELTKEWVILKPEVVIE